jgi:glucosamine--fructose-6-phosphate aminotransferase (isomerizing)
VATRPTSSEPVEISVAAEDLELSGYQHYMLKEIHEQPDAAAMVLRGWTSGSPPPAWTGSDSIREEAPQLPPHQDPRLRIRLLRGQLGAQLIEDLARIPADAEAASEFRYRQPIIESDTLYVAVSQSGETADTPSPSRRSSARADVSSAS